MKQRSKKLWSILLSLALLMGLLSGMTLTASAVVVTEYPLWVGSTQVTSANMDNVLGDGTVSFTPANGDTPATLTLNNADITEKHNNSGIYYEGSDALNIALEGNNKVNENAANYYGIRSKNSNADVTISGTGSLTVSGSSDAINSYHNVKITGGNVIASGEKGINADNDVMITGGTVTVTGTAYDGSLYCNSGNITISGGDVNVTGEYFAIFADEGDIQISGGTVKATGSGNSATAIKAMDGGVSISDSNVEASGSYDGIESYKNVTITASTVTASATKDLGITTFGNITISGKSTVDVTGRIGINAYGNITIGSDIDAVTVTGSFKAMGSAVKNAVAGIGWTNVEGTGDGTSIAVSTEGQELNNYKKVQFQKKAAEKATITTAPTAKTLTYNGEAQKLVTAGVAEGGTMQYYVVSADAKTEWSADIPTGTEAGTYSVWYKAVGDAYHTDSDVYSVSMDISPATMTITVTGDQKTFTYDGEVHAADGYTITCDAELFDASKVVFTGSAYVTGTDVGTYPMGLQTAYFTYDDTSVIATFNVIDGALTISAQPSYSGGSAPTTYKINLPAETAGGKLIVSPERAAKGATVTITAKPDEGYKAETPVVKDKDGKEIPVTQNADGTWSFIMPDGDVTVTGKFVPEKAQLKFVDVPADAWYYNDVYWAVDKGITLGVDDTHFAPNAACTRAQFVTFLWRAAGKPAPTSAVNPFEDVKADAYYYEAVLWAVEKGVTKGTDATHFSPEKSVTRAEGITFLYRYEQTLGKGFTGLWAFQLDDYADAADVPDWAYEAFCWMVKEDICKGADGKLEPAALCPRCQVVALLARVFAE